MNRSFPHTVPLVAVALVVAFVAATAAHSQEKPPAESGGTVTELPAVISGARTLDGHYRMTRDLRVLKGGVLRIAAGTVIEIAGRDARAEGASKRFCEISIEGRLIVDGTAADPVEFRGERRARWLGIRLMNERERAPKDSGLRGFKLRGAVAGVQVSEGRPQIDRCVFTDCRVGVVAGRTVNDQGARIQLALAPRPEISDCVFTRCGIGVLTELDASPHVLRSSFLDCPIGVGNEARIASVFPVKGLGARVHRSLFVRNQCGILGSAVVQDSIFLSNDVVLRVTDFHDRFSQNVERLSWRANVMWNNARLALGESDFGGDHIIENPLLEGVPPAGAEQDLTAPLAVALAESSPVRGRATDGGDPGPSGRAPAGRKRRAWTPLGTRLESVFAAAPLPKDVKIHTAATSITPSVLKANRALRQGPFRWSVFDVGAQGAFAPSPFLFPGGEECVVSFPFSISGAEGDSAELEINVDGAVRVWVDGKSVTVGAKLQRFGSRGTHAPIRVGNGRHEVSLRWRRLSRDALLGVAVAPPPGGVTESGLAGAPDVASLRAVPVRYRADFLGYRIDTPTHWADLDKPGSVSLVLSDDRELDLSPLGRTTNERGAERVPLPEGIAAGEGDLVFRGLRDPRGRLLRGQPLRISLER